ncbi:unnamed protein product [Bemisia tabaci]|uniref:Major facilitator superfamily (MFS) profile domain-containing protein n=1 Tax=Bemisia tabaci TaxID=7038 RepID=A0A9P0F4Y8_BEMTA|nr:unnamed protein product [Bemisia tabaci]
MGWPAPTLKILRHPSSEVHLTPSEEAWVVNAMYVTSFLSPLPSGVLMDTIGRKTTMVVLCLFPIISWILIFYQQTGLMLLIARAFAGVFVGGVQMLSPVYAGEIAEPRVRGIAGALIMVHGFAGAISVYIIGPYVSIRTMAVIGGAFPIIFLLLFTLCPESPYYYIMRGRQKSAEEALTWLRGGAPVKQELDIIQTAIEKETQSGKGYFTNMLSLVTVPGNRKAFFIVEVMNFMQRFSGLSCLTVFSTIVLPERVGPVTSDHGTLLMGVCCLLASLGCIALIDKVGRKPLLYFSSIGIFFSMLPTAFWYYLDRETSTDVTEVNWIPYAGFLSFAATLSLGLGTIAPAYKGEMFPSDLKGQACALTSIIVGIASALGTALFPVLTKRTVRSRRLIDEYISAPKNVREVVPHIIMFVLKFNAVEKQLAAAFVGWPAPTLRFLREPESEVHLTPTEEVWVVSALYVTTFLSPLPCGSLMDKLGRRGTMLTLCIFPIISWVLIYFAQTGSTYLIARFVAGVWCGGSPALMNGYAGAIFIYIIGPYVSIPTMAVIGGAFPVIYFLLFSLCPESPYFYILRGRHDAAGGALAWLRAGAPIKSELAIIRASIERETQYKRSYLTKLLSFVTAPHNRRAFFMVGVMNFMQKFCGLSCLTVFSTVILPEQIGPLTPDHCTLILGITWLLASIGCIALIDKVGRKPLLYLSSIGISLSMLPTAAWYYFDRETATDVTEVNWVPFAGFLGFAVTLSLGLGTIAPAYKGEMFPSNLKGQASALTSMIICVAATISTALFPILTSSVGLYANFLLFALTGPVNFIFTYYCVIETKGKTLQMIQAELNGETLEKI